MSKRVCFKVIVCILCACWQAQWTAKRISEQLFLESRTLQQPHKCFSWVWGFHMCLHHTHTYSNYQVHVSVHIYMYKYKYMYVSILSICYMYMSCIGKKNYWNADWHFLLCSIKRTNLSLIYMYSVHVHVHVDIEAEQTHINGNVKFNSS